MGIPQSKSSPDNGFVLEANPVELGPTGKFKKFPNRSGLKLGTYWWPAEGTAKAVMLVLHGHGAYIPFEFLALNPKTPGAPKSYNGSWVQRWNQEGYSVVGIDYQSCGRSESIRGLRNDYNRFQNLVDDALDFVRSVKVSEDPQFGKLPIFGTGISLGGCVLAHTAHQGGDIFQGCALLAPMLSLEKIKQKPINRILRPFGALLNWLVPTWAVIDVPRNTMFPDVQLDLDMDPYMYHGWTRARTAVELLWAADLSVAEMPRMTFPFVVFHSKRDTVNDPEGSAMLFERSQAEDKTLISMDKMWHSLTCEPGNQEVLQKILEWTNQRVKV